MSTLSREEFEDALQRYRLGLQHSDWNLLPHDASQRAELEAKDKEIARLTTERDEALKDSERLDAFPRIGYVLWQSDEGLWKIRKQGEEYKEAAGESPRQAIDSAMEQEKHNAD